MRVEQFAEIWVVDTEFYRSLGWLPILFAVFVR